MGGLAEQTGAKSCWKPSGLQILWADWSNLGLKSHFIDKISLKQSGFPAQCLEENVPCCVTACKLWNDSDPREKGRSCSSWFGKTLYTPSPHEAGAGPDTLSLSASFLLRCIQRLQWEYPNESKFNVWHCFFFCPVFSFEENTFIFEGGHITTCCLSLASGVKQIRPSHSSGPLGNITLFFRSGLQPSSAPCVLDSWQLVSLLIHTKNPKPRRSGLLTHWTRRD